MNQPWNDCTTVVPVTTDQSYVSSPGPPRNSQLGFSRTKSARPSSSTGSAHVVLTSMISGALGGAGSAGGGGAGAHSGTSTATATANAGESWSFTMTM